MDFAETMLPTSLGQFYMRVYQFSNQPDITVLASLPFDDLKNHQPLPVRLHSSCLTGDIFASQRCDCGEQLKKSLGMIQEKGGLLIYLNQEGRGIGLFNKIKAYALQDQGFDTVEANVQLGLAVDDRNYKLACDIIKSLGLNSIQLITNNPDKIHACTGSGLKVEPIPLSSTQYHSNQKYLWTKVNKLNHFKTLVSE
jgi:3,4-dihydroxy 2-butanone 4-phosphate synthase/GTP cyclohydrolase II